MAGAALVFPAVGLAAIDLATRREQIGGWSSSALFNYALTLVLSGVLWAGLVAASAGRRAWGSRLLLATCALFAVGAQRYFFARYHAYLNPRAVLVGTSMLPSVRQQLWSDRTAFALAVVPPVVAAFLAVWAHRRGAEARLRAEEGRGARKGTGGRRALDLGVGALLAATFAIPVRESGPQAIAPDVLYLSSLGRLASARWLHDDAVERAHPGPRTPLPVPTFSVGQRRRSLLFVVTESVRATDACSLPTPGCLTTPFTNSILPDRFGFTQMRALDSTTAASLAVLWSGLPPTAAREALHSAPLLWEYAHAAGFDTAYWTSQNMFFANSGTWLEGLPLSHWVTATDLDEDPTYELGADDAKLVDVVARDLATMRSPFVGVVHLSNTHFPYRIDEEDAPFQPQARAFGAGDAAKVHNRYRDAIHRQDEVVARLVRSVRAMPGGDQTILVFISDHGEQIRERGAIGHTWGVYDEELRVPVWIDLPQGVASPEQRRALRSLAEAPLTQLDVLPTILDLAGIWDAPEIASFRGKMPGESLLRGGTPRREVVVTNCTSIFACAFKNWGAMRGTMKLVATQNDVRWRCFDVERDPDERRDLGVEACSDLQAVAEAGGRGRPF